MNFSIEFVTMEKEVWYRNPANKERIKKNRENYEKRESDRLKADPDFRGFVCECHKDIIYETFRKLRQHEYYMNRKYYN